ncbi:MAG: Undecaprenol glycosyltransferase [Parcubacteria group bacterium GW2011_GWD2_43_10]|uniref:Glycosyl transferase family 2 n=3 Tax=Candidatus Vebleniibacteriota TaxID=1817921 RepID=A0A1G2QB45_9BACT|nr:MAG: Undecaprenol glycosyltransferase [Parcubacteria group bacterium GW2011_GWA2_42_80]KKS78088.1 MAG: Undecaprenol glycosyltransferase [Parcubacteria group bacterium GW2011_GWD1_42_9]KKS83614.1 MAG: Undecaprenol glycosyltransferase [Parcubacteria group bacterium GW2011_GWD2_43_10]KKS93167.1 MAG: Undecaprenol glycosyltransferase [Parcubacteria group bacterium GW2011_GWE2_43_12]KKT13989.1 MAG: Undecaprenol glycosyltransferase [Parcubacteria group bacterium GW2011_GWA1_43_27]KKT15751.1 MAG: U
MSPPTRELSVVVPLLNESESLAGLCDGLRKKLDGKIDYEIVFVDDGSRDNSWKVITDLYHEYDNIKAVSFRSNRGKSYSLAAGFIEASGKIIVTMDADLQDEPADILRMVDKINEGYDVVAGWKHRKASLFRLILTKIFNFSVRATTGIKLHDFNCSLKVYRSEVVRNIKLYGELHRFLPVLASWQGFRVTEIKVANYERRYGRSKYGLARIWRGFFDLASIVFIVRYGKKPLHVFGGLGMLFFTIGFIVDLYMTMLRFQGEKIGDRPLFMLGTLMIVLGVQFFTMGLLGESINYSFSDSRESRNFYREVLKHDDQ